MNNHIDTLRTIMTAFGYAEDRINAAIRSLILDPSDTVMPAEEKSLMTPKALCDALQISGTTLFRLGPPFRRVGSRKRYLLSDVLEYLDQKGGK